MRRLGDTGRLRVTLVAAIVAVGVSGGLCAPAFALLRGLVASQYGAGVDQTTGASFCTLASSDVCQAGQVSAVPGGFGEASPQGVAAAPNGNLYAVDLLNNRVQELTPSGEFVLMFGKEVNETKVNTVNAGGGTPTQTQLEEENVCTKVEVEAGVECKRGERGSEAGAFIGVRGVTVDPSSGNVYVSEEVFGNDRVDEFSGSGHFILMLGKKVNETTGGNICTQVEVEAGRKCQAAEEFGSIGSNEHGAFVFYASSEELAAGGPQDLLYVGSEHRVQEFDSAGAWVGEIDLTGIDSGTEARVTALAVDQANGDVYLVYVAQSNSSNVIYEFTPVSGKPTEYSKSGEFALSPRSAGASIALEGISLDSVGHLAVVERESGSVVKWFGSILAAGTGARGAGFPILVGEGGFSSVPALTFNASGELYGASPERHELVGYLIAEGAEVIAKPATCQEADEQHETLLSFVCTFNGEVNPSNVSGTEAWFEVTMKTVGGTRIVETPKQEINPPDNALHPVSALLEGLRPKETYPYTVTAYDDNFKPPTPAMMSEQEFLTTPSVPPMIGGEPIASFVGPTSAVLHGEVDPENTTTEYYFEYGPGETLAKCTNGVRLETCPGVLSTRVLSSGVYGAIGVTDEATGLQPSTNYHFRLAAANQNNETAINENHGATLPEGEFMTLPQPVAEPLECVLCPSESEALKGAPPLLLSPPVPSQLLRPEGISWPKPPCKLGFRRDKHGHCFKLKRGRSGTSKRHRGKHHHRARKG
jgi:hypothetical protein